MLALDRSMIHARDASTMPPTHLVFPSFAGFEALDAANLLGVDKLELSDGF